MEQNSINKRSVVFECQARDNGDPDEEVTEDTKVVQGIKRHFEHTINRSC